MCKCVFMYFFLLDESFEVRLVSQSVAHWDLVIIVMFVRFFLFFWLAVARHKSDNELLKSEHTIQKFGCLGLILNSVSQLPKWLPSNMKIERNEERKNNSVFVFVCVSVLVTGIHTYKFKIWMPERQAGHWRKKNRSSKQILILFGWLRFKYIGFIGCGCVYRK